VNILGLGTTNPFLGKSSVVYNDGLVTMSTSSGVFTGVVNSGGQAAETYEMERRGEEK